jgi:cytochrome b subunit of formate dehydrogenase
LFASFLFANRGFDRWVKWFFLANFLVTPLIGFVYFYPTFSYTLLLLGTPWIVTASGSMLVLSLYFRRRI